jgi:threonine dehydratase
MSPELERILSEAVGPSPDDSTAIRSALTSAREIVRGYLTESPLRRSTWLSDLTGGDVWLKLECLNPNGSFKVRGALNAIAQRFAKNPQLKKPVKFCAASAGNHAQGVAFAARAMGCESHIFLPKRTPLVKRDATVRLGGNIYLVGDVVEEAFDAALQFAEKEQAQFLHAFNDFDVIAGQGTCVMESLEQYQAISGKPSKGVDEFICSIGGGGLASGAGMVMKLFTQHGKVTGVEQEFFDSAHRSLRESTREPVTKTGSVSIADGISVRLIGNLNYSYIKSFVHSIKLVSDDNLVAACLGLLEREHVVSEGAGAAAVAALLKNPQHYAGKTVIACVSGGNIDPQLMMRVIARGLNVTGRTLKILVKVGDRPGELRRLLEEVAGSDANILEVYHDRTYTQVTVGEVDVELALETRGSEHQYELIERLEELGYKPRIPHA